MPELSLEKLSSHLPGFARSIEAHYLLLSSWLESHLPRIGTLIACTTLSLYARHVTDRARQLAMEWPFLLRVGLFIGVVGFGFSLAIATASPLITAGLELAGRAHLVPTILVCFLIVGILAERSGRI